MKNKKSIQLTLVCLKKQSQQEIMMNFYNELEKVVEKEEWQEIVIGNIYEVDPEKKSI